MFHYVIARYTRASARSLELDDILHESTHVCREETEKEVNVKARMPAWAKGKSVVLDLSKNHIKLALQEEKDKPIIEVLYSNNSFYTLHDTLHDTLCYGI